MKLFITTRDIIMINKSTQPISEDMSSLDCDFLKINNTGLSGNNVIQSETKRTVTYERNS